MRKHGAEVPNAEQAFGERMAGKRAAGRRMAGKQEFGGVRPKRRAPHCGKAKV